MTQHERPLTVKQFATEMQCSVQLVYNMVRAGKLAHFRLGSLLRIPASELRRLVDEAERSAPQVDEGDPPYVILLPGDER